VTPARTRGSGSRFGYGEWTAQVTDRGGDPVRFDFPWSSLSMTRVLNGNGDGKANILSWGPGAPSRGQVLAGSEPWRHELALYRDGELAFVGPVQKVGSREHGDLYAQDLFAWMEVRFIEEDFHGDGDVAGIFRAVFDAAYDKDDSPNIQISTRSTGVDAVRDYKAVEFQWAADAMRELARTGLDFTMDGRRLLAGGAEVFLSDDPLILHDEGVVYPAEVTREGDGFATDVAVFGNTTEVGGVPITGRATRSSSVYGVVQRSFTELKIRDTPSATANAIGRLEAVQPAPLRVRATLTPEAAFGFGDLVPGRRFEVYLRESSDIPVSQTMRLQHVDASITANEEAVEETVVVQLIPLGVTEEA
jgi:hypothetical protein